MSLKRLETDKRITFPIKEGHNFGRVTRMGLYKKLGFGSDG